MTELPEPLTPSDCDLQGLEYMPLLGTRLFGSEFNARVTDAEWRAAITLWWAAWTQRPAASLPDDDISLCRLADLGRDVRAWKKVKAGALSGFVKCSDGRLYHPTLSEQAVIAWNKRLKERERKAQWRAKKQGQDADVPNTETGTETGQERGQDADVPADVTRRDVTLVIEEKEEEEVDAPKRVSGAEYAFEGSVIRLTRPDFDRWRTTYHAIPDIRAELVSLDGWLTAQPPERRLKWFHTVSGALNRKHQDLLVSDRKRDAAALPDGPAIC